MLFVMIGGFFGAISRFLVGKWLTHYTTTPIPTLCINMLGSFLFSLAWLYLDGGLFLLCAPGFLGAFTTFSTFSYEALQLLVMRKYTKAVLYIVGSVGCCALGGWIGLQL